LIFLLLFAILGEHGSPSSCYLQWLVSVCFICVVICSTSGTWFSKSLVFAMV
jgi:hypothetical protein